jgi:integrase
MAGKQKDMTQLEAHATISGSVGRGERADGKEIPMARRRYQRGSIRKKNGKWTLRYREDAISTDGTIRRISRTRILMPASDPKKDARRAADAFLAQLNFGNARPMVAATLEEFWSGHFKPLLLPSMKPASQGLYETLAAVHILPVFGHERMMEISRAQVQAFIAAKQRQGYAPKTLAHIRSFLGKLFNVAIDWGWIQTNPASKISLPKMARRREQRVLKPEEISKLAAELPEPSRTMVLLGALLGLRIGEMLGLKAGDVDLLGGWLYVRRNVYRGHVQETPKTESSDRRLPIPDTLKSSLTTHHQGKGPNEWLFPTPAGTPHDDRNLLRREIEPACKRLEIPRFSWHALRHTFSTYSGNNGMAMPVLQSLLGHTSAEMTIRYTHPLESAQRDAIERIAEILWPNVAQTKPAPITQKELIN